MLLFILIQNINESNTESDGGIRHWLGENVYRLEVYQWGDIRVTILGATDIEVMPRLTKWSQIRMSNLIAWEKVS